MLKTTNYFHFHLIRLTIEFPLPVEKDLLQERNCFPRDLDPPSLHEHRKFDYAKISDFCQKIDKTNIKFKQTKNSLQN